MSKSVIVSRSHQLILGVFAALSVALISTAVAYSQHKKNPGMESLHPTSESVAVGIADPQVTAVLVTIRLGMSDKTTERDLARFAKYLAEASTQKKAEFAALCRQINYSTAGPRYCSLTAGSG